jgi:hypothetical protein
LKAVPQFNKAQTRQQLIDPALAKAIWDVHNKEQMGTKID